MRKTIMFGVMIAGLLVAVSATVVFAREPEAPRKQEEYDFIIEEALDQIEKNFDPAIVREESSIGPEISVASEMETGKGIPVGSEGLEDVVEIEGWDLNESVAEDPVALEKGPEAGEVGLDTIISVEGGNIDEQEEVFEAKIIPLLHAEASSLIEALGRMKSPEGEVSYDEKGRALILKDASGRLKEMSAFVKETDILLKTEIFALEYARARDIVVNIEEALTKNVGQVQFDEESNSVVVTDTPVKIGKIKELIQSLDRFHVEVLIGARILKIVLNDEHPEGVDWEAIVSEYQKLALSGKGNKDRKQLGLGTISREDYDILLEALDVVGVVRTVFEEDIRTENETTETISSLVSLRRDEEVRFYLTPMIKKGEPLEVAIKIKEAEQENVTVQMENGETIVIGGLFENVMVASTWKIPLLGDLPLLGFVFRDKGEESRRAESITFLTVKTVEKKKL